MTYQQKNSLAAKAVIPIIAILTTIAISAVGLGASQIDQRLDRVEDYVVVNDRRVQSIEGDRWTGVMQRDHERDIHKLLGNLKDYMVSIEKNVIVIREKVERLERIN